MMTRSIEAAWLTSDRSCSPSFQIVNRGDIKFHWKMTAEREMELVLPVSRSNAIEITPPQRIYFMGRSPCERRLHGVNGARQ